MENKIVVNIPEGQTAPIEFIHREGQALPQKDNMQKFSRDVSITSIATWIAGRKFPDTIADNNAVIVFNKTPSKASIEFHANPQDKEATVLTSKLTVNPDLAAWKINSDITFTSEALIKHVRKYAHCMESSYAKGLIDQLRNFQATLTTNLERSNDGKGNKGAAVKQAINFSKGQLPDGILLELPLFNGTAPYKMTLEIEVDEDNGQPVYSFYCLEYDGLLKTKAEEFIIGIVEPLSSKFVVLEQV